MDRQQEAEKSGIGLADVTTWIGYAAFVGFLGIPLVGAALGVVVFVGGVLSLLYALLPFVIGLAVIAGAIWAFTSE